MIPVNKRIVVRVNMKQKDTMIVGGVRVSCALLYNPNYRERSPVVGEIISGNKYLRSGQIAIFHHNHFYPPSPYFLYDDLYSVPFNKTVFGVLDTQGNLIPFCGNIFGQRMVHQTSLPVPVERQEKYIDRILITSPGWTVYKAGQILLHRRNAAYDIVYHWNDQERIVTKVHEEMVIGIAESKK